ncbi:MAG: hypothetical protein HY537_01700 [Deltaproteobacteria bacterium]|nr:hypothetical protein [Deltaproteobacteria bacterium]
MAGVVRIAFGLVLVLSVTMGTVYGQELPKVGPNGQKIIDARAYGPYMNGPEGIPGMPGPRPIVQNGPGPEELPPPAPIDPNGDLPGLDPRQVDPNGRQFEPNPGPGMIPNRRPGPNGRAFQPNPRLGPNSGLIAPNPGLHRHGHIPSSIFADVSELVILSSEVRAIVDDVRDIFLSTPIQSLDPRSLHRFLSDPLWREFYLIFLDGSKDLGRRLAELRQVKGIDIRSPLEFLNPELWDRYSSYVTDGGLFEHVLLQRLSDFNKELARLRMILEKSGPTSPQFRAKLFSILGFSININKALILFEGAASDSVFVGRYLRCPEPDFVLSLLEKIEYRRVIMANLLDRVVQIETLGLARPLCNIYHGYRFGFNLRRFIDRGVNAPLLPTPHFDPRSAEVIGPLAPEELNKPRRTEPHPIQQDIPGPAGDDRGGTRYAPPVEFDEETAVPRGRHIYGKLPLGNGGGARQK